AFSGEEEGLIGSAYYVAHPIVPLAQTGAMINMDMIGRLKEDKLLVGGVGTAQEWREMVARADTEPEIKQVGAPESDHGSAPGKVTAVIGTNGQMVATIAHRQRFALTLSEDGYGPSDHSSFYAKQVPVLFVWTGNHEDYHKPTDTADKLNYEGEARIISFVRDIAGALDASDK